jgi:hypothetical protein
VTATDVELFVGGDWVSFSDVTRNPNMATPYVLDEVTVKRGYDSENSSIAPSTCDLQVDARSGNLSPRNPLGDYFGSLGRNTPVRVARPLLGNSTFGSNATNSWSNTDDGLAWTLSGSGGTVQASDWQVTGGKGTMSVPAVGYRRARLAGVSYVDCEIAGDVTVPVADVTGGTLEPLCMEFRGVGSSYYLLRVAITTAEAVTLSVELDTGTVITAPVTVPGLTHSSSQTLRVKAHIEGAVLRAKVWPAASAEPQSWHLRSVDNSRTYRSGGFVSLRCGRGTSNSNGTVVFSVDNLVIRSPRYIGELGALPVRWDITGADPMVSIDAAGVIRRMSQGDAPVKSPLFRSITSQPTSAKLIFYWPCEDPDGSTVLASAITGGRPLGIGYVSPDFAAYDDFPGSDPIPTLQNGEWSAALSQSSSTGILLTRFLLHMPAVDEAATGQALIQLFAFGSRWDVQYQAGGNLQLRAFDSAATQLYASASMSYGLQNKPVMVSLKLAVSGSNTLWNLDTLDLSGNAVGNAATATGVTFGRLSKILVNPIGGYVDVAFGHLHIQAAATVFSLLAGPMSAYTGETAGDRIARACADLGVQFVQVGPDSVTTLGPQESGDPMAVIEAAINASLDLLYEPRGDFGLELRTLPSLYNQDAALPLDYAASHLSAAPPPVDDDRHTRNDVTVSRSGGSSARYTVDDGPLSTQPPPDGVGRYQDSVTIAVDTDAQLADQASWRASIGTVNEARFPTVPINLAKPEVSANPGLVAAALATNVGDRLTIDNASAADFYDQISQLVIGSTETMDPVSHEITFSCVPESTYQVTKLDTPGYGRLGSKDSVLLNDLTTASTIVPVVTEPSGTLWTTRTGLATATAVSLAGNYLQCLDADATDVNIGDECVLYTAAGSLLDQQVHTVTSKPSGFGSTNLTFTPSLSGAWPVVGDTLRAFPPGRFPIPLIVAGERVDAYDINPQGPTLRAVGAAAHADNASVAPGLPAGTGLGDLQLLLAAIRNTAATVNTPTGWSVLCTLGTHVKLFGRQAPSPETAPTVTFSGGSAGDTCSAQIAGFVGATITVWASATQTNGSAQDIAFPFLAVPMDGALIIHVGWKQDDWTSVAALAGGTEIGEPSSTLGNDQGLVWDYRVQTSLANLAAGSFTVTGGAAAVSKSAVVALSGNVQIFGLVRGVNDVSKSHAAGEQIRLYRPGRLGL